MNSVAKIADCPNMTSAVHRGCKATNQTDKKALFVSHMSRDIRKPTFWFQTWSDTNKAVQL